MIAKEEAMRLAMVMRTSGRLRQENQKTLDRALLLVLSRRDEFASDAEEAMVQAVARIVMTDLARDDV